MALYDGLEEVADAKAPVAPAPPPSMYEGLQEVTPTLTGQPREAKGAIESIQAGFQGSAPGLAWRGKLPDLMVNPETAAWWERALSGVGQIGAELPLMIGGAIAGAPAGAAVGTAVAPGLGTAAGGVLGAGFGMGAVPAAIRTSLIEAYKAGDAKTAIDWWAAIKEVATHTVKEGAINAAAMGAGAVAARTLGTAIAPAVGQKMTAGTFAAATETADIATQIATMTTAPALILEGRLPHMQEVLDAAILIAGLKGAHVTATRIMDVYQKTGKTPAQQVADAQADPKIAQELAAQPDEPMTPPDRLQMLKLQENLFKETAALAEIEAKQAAEPLADPERLEFNAAKQRIAALEAQIKAGTPPEPAKTAAFTPEQFTEAKAQADARLAELSAKTGALTDAERAERVFLTNAQPEALAKRFGIEPVERKAPTPEEHDASAKAVYDDVLQQLTALDASRRAAGQQPLYEAPPEAIAALVQRQVEVWARDRMVTPEQIYKERYLTIRDESQIPKAEEAPLPPDAVMFTEPEVDLFGEPIQPQVVPRIAVADLATQEVPLANLVLSKEVPQFKHAANEEGVVQALGGKFDRTGVGPIQVWERTDGTMEVISGRHRLDLAKRSGEQTIPAQIHREAEGFTARMAATLDAELNIREEQGSVADYAQYFKDSGKTREAADELGLLARAKGRTGFAIARDASPDLLAAHRAGLLSDEAALSISTAAPGSERLQALGIAMVNEGKSILVAVNNMKAVELLASERMGRGEQGDIFGFDDSAMKEAAALAKKATSIQRQIGEQIAAVIGAAKRPELAKKMGVDVADPQGIQNKVLELRQTQTLWDNWPMHPELVAKLRELNQPRKINFKKLDPDDAELLSPEELAQAIEYWANRASLNDAREGGFKSDASIMLDFLEDLRASQREAAPYKNILNQAAPDLPETPAEAAARDREAVEQALRKESPPNILNQSSRVKENLDRVLEQHGEDRFQTNKDQVGKNQRISVATANKLAKKGDPDAGAAALIVYVTDDFMRLSADTKLKEPATKALIDYVKEMPGTKTGPLYRVLGFETKDKAVDFLMKFKEGETSAMQSERPVMSFTTDDPTGKNAFNNIGIDQASIHGDHLVVLKVQPQTGTALTIGRDVSYLYGPKSEGVDVLVPKDQQFRVRSIEPREGGATVTLEPAKGAQDAVLFQGKQEPFYSALAREVDTAQMKQAGAQGWRDWLKGLVSNNKAKADEIKWSGIEDWLALMGDFKYENYAKLTPEQKAQVEAEYKATGKKGMPKITKEQVQEYLKNNGVRVEVKQTGADREAMYQDAQTRATAENIPQDMFSRLFGERANWMAEQPGETFPYEESAQRYMAGSRTFQRLGVTPEMAAAMGRRLEQLIEPIAEVRAESTKFSSYVLPGGTNYRERLLVLPPKTIPGSENVWDGYARSFYGKPYEELNAAQQAETRRVTTGSTDQVDFRSSHFDTPNILAHERVTDREVPIESIKERFPETYARLQAEGKTTAKIRFSEEFQSDWAQKGRKEGFKKEWTQPEVDKFTVEDTLPDPTPPPELKNHKMWSKGDFLYFRDKGYDDAEIKAFWDRDAAAGGRPADQKDYLRTRSANRDYIIRDGEGNTLVTAPGHLNNSAEAALADARRAALKGELKMSGVSAAPFVGKTDAWAALTLKSAIRDAVDGGYDIMAWTRGEQQVERYSSALRKAVDEIHWKKTPEGVQIVGYKGNKRESGLRERLNEDLNEVNRRMDELLGDRELSELNADERAQMNRMQVAYQNLAMQITNEPSATKVVDTTEKESALSDAIGKSMAEQIKNDPNQEGVISGDNINVSDTGMAGFYDNIMPKIANKVLKQLGGGKTSEVVLNTADTIGNVNEGSLAVVRPNGEVIAFTDYDSQAHEIARENAGATVIPASEVKSSGSLQHAFEITTAMREGANKGQPLFQKQQQDNRASFDVANRIITTFETADKSSILHELGHGFLEDLKYFATLPDATPRAKAMWDVARREFAIPENGEISRASHELNAKSFERYLGEGEAPTPELRSMFEQFKQWMLQVYTDLSNIMKDRINPEVRKLFDDMLRIEEDKADAKEMNVPVQYIEVARAEEAHKIVPGDAARKVAEQPFADELPPGPGEAPSNSHINYKYVNAPTDVKLMVQRMVEIDQANVQAKRGGTDGVKSWKDANAEQEKLVADMLGGDPNDLQGFINKVLGTSADQTRIDTLYGVIRKAVTGAAQDAAARRDIILAKGHDATVAEQLEYLGSLERLRMMQAEMLGQRASIARALNQMKDTTEGSGEIVRMLDAIGVGDGRTLFQAERTAQQKALDEQAAMKLKLDEILLAYKGKTVLDIAKLHKEIGTLKGSIKFAEDLQKATTWEMVVEAWKAGLLSGPQTPVTNLFGTSAFQFMRPAVDALATIIGVARGASPGMGESNRASMSESVARLTGMIGGVQEGLILGWHALKVEELTGKTETYKAAIPGKVGDVIRFPYRLMAAGDQITSTMYRRGELATLAIRRAFDEQLNPSTREFAERVQALKDNPTPEMMAEADAAATRMTFNNKGGEKMIATQNFVNKWNLQWMVPFIRTPLNVAEEMLRMSPFAPSMASWRADIAKGGVARDRAIAELTLGAGIMALTAAYAFDGKITGSGDPDPGKNRAKAGVSQPNSVLIGDKWYEIGRIQPMGTLMGLAADMAMTWDKMNDEEKDQIPKMLAMAFSNAITNQTFLQGITNVVHMMSEPDRYGSRFFQGMAGSMVPNVIGQPTAMADPYVRQVNSMLEAVQSRIPGYRQDLVPKKDWLGADVPTKERVGVVGPSRIQPVTEDKVRLEAARLGMSIADAPKKLHLGRGTGKLGTVDLTPEERATFAKVGGEMAHKILTEVVNAPGWDTTPKMVQKRIFSKILTASHRMGAISALPPDKRQAYLNSISEKVAQELSPVTP